MLKILVTSVIIGIFVGCNGTSNDWWQSALIYQIYLRSFKDSDGDGVGDIRGVTSKIPYLEELGVNAIVLSPIFKSPLNDFGFDIQDYYSLNSEYGNVEDFDRMVKVANEHNIKILLDFIPNHTSNESEWFVKSEHKDEYYSDWYVWEEGHIDNHGKRSPPNNWMSVFKGSAWEYSPLREQYFLHQFGKTEPDLNYRNPVVLEEIKNIIKFWLEKGIAGMRLSSVNHLFESDKELFGGQYPEEPVSGYPGVTSDQYRYLQHIHTTDHEENFDVVAQIRDVFDAISLRDNLTRILITEAHATAKNAVRYYGRSMHHGAHIPVNFVLIDELNKDSDARDIKHAMDLWMTYKPLKKQANWMIGNHDVSRVASRFGPGLVDAFNMLILLSPGIAISYMGEEIGMTNGFISWGDTRDPLACRTDDPVNYVEVSRDPFRTPFQWSTGKNAGFSTADRTWIPVNDGFERTNSVTQKASVRSHYQVYKNLATLRTRAAFKHGRYASLVLNNDVFAFKRWYNEEAYVVVMNIGKFYHVVNLTAFDLIFGQLEVEVSSVISPRTYSDIVQATSLDLVSEEALVLRMQV